MRYRIDLSYDGAPFCGWQIQPSDPSVQEELEKALSTLLRSSVGVVGAGRTDTGVSATRYVAHFDFDGAIDCKQLAYKLNAILPKAISIQGIAPAADDFHARFDAVCRQYQYYIHRRKDPFLEGRSFYYGYPDVDFEAMNKAAELLLGRHDFSCFEKSGGDNKTSVCTVYKAIWEPYTPELSSLKNAAGKFIYWRFTIEADRFLRNMVRAIVGTLLEVGRSRRSKADFASLILDAPASPGTPQAEKPSLRSNAGESVPGHALFLTDIRY
ncbi:MAG: tRNA pseudouridine(38-40) synthase TruA [Bacteroidales bacterium]|nr:tRNA pseudouridine(38-40) synthase TruA [Bacteroidales bacterium]